MLLEYRLYGVIQDVVFTHQPHFRCSFLSLICLSTNQNIQLIHSPLIRIEWTTGNGIFMSSSHWPIHNKLYPGAHHAHLKYYLHRFLEVKALDSALSEYCGNYRNISLAALMCWPSYRGAEMLNWAVISDVSFTA